jgi:O-antigen/teichoic acid export membrane protein
LLLNISYWLFAGNKLTPGIEFSFKSLSQMGKFGISLLASAILNQGVQNAYGLLIGKAFSFEQLAFYNRARGFHQLPALTLSRVLNRVMFPVFATIQNDNERILRGVRKGVPLIAFVVIPVMALLICAAEEIVVLLLTDKWLPAAEYMRWFPILGVTYPLAAFELSVLKSKGKSRLFFILDIIKSGISIAILLFTIPFGVMEVVIGQIVTSLVSIVFVNAPAFSYTFGYRIKDQFFDVFPSILVGGIATTIAFFVTQFFAGASMIFILLVKVVVLGVVYLSLSHFFQLSGMSEMVKGVRKLLSQGKQRTRNGAHSVG